MTIPEKNQKENFFFVKPSITNSLLTSAICLMTGFLMTGLNITAQQQIPNSDFEQWVRDTIYEDLDLWETPNKYSKNTKKTTDRISGNYAVRMETVEFDGDTILGYITIGDIISFEGGIPFTVSADSIKGYFKYSVVPGDTALMGVAYKNNLDSINTIIKITGTQNTWKKFEFRVDTIANPDSLLIAFASSNGLGQEFPGSYLFLDSIYLSSSSGKTIPVLPNFNFENWTSYYVDDLAQWATFNSLMPSLPTARDTGDAYSGSSALVIEQRPYNPDDVPGIVTLGYFTENGIKGGIPFTDKPAALYGYCKFLPHQPGDSAIIIVYFKKNDSTVAGGRFLITSPISSYTRFSIPLFYSGTPDSMNIILISYNNNALLFVDSLNFYYPATNIHAINTEKFTLFPNPASSIIHIGFPSGCTYPVSIRLTDLHGRLIKTQTCVDQSQKEITMDVRDLSGEFIIQIQSAGRSISKKLTLFY